MNGEPLAVNGLGRPRRRAGLLASIRRARSGVEAPVHGSPFTVHGRRAGVTLVEMMIALAVVGLMAAISYPSFSAGLDSVRLRSSVDQAAIFWAKARLRADRSQLPVQVTVDPKKNELRAVGAESDWRESFAPSEGVRMVEPKELRSYIIYPGMPSPQFEAAFESRGGVRAGLRIDVFTGLPEEWNGE